MNYKKLLQILLFVSIGIAQMPVVAGATQGSSSDSAWYKQWALSFLPQDKKSQMLAGVSVLATILALINVYQFNQQQASLEDHISTCKKAQKSELQCFRLLNIVKNLYTQLFNTTEAEVETISEYQSNAMLDRVKELQKLLEQKSLVEKNPVDRNSVKTTMRRVKSRNGSDNNSFGIEQSVIFGNNNVQNVKKKKINKYVIDNIEQPQGTRAQITLKKIKRQHREEQDDIIIQSDNSDDNNNIERVVIVLDEETVAALMKEQGGTQPCLEKLLKNRAQSFAEKSTKNTVVVTYIVIHEGAFKDNHYFPAIASIHGISCDLLVCIGQNIPFNRVIHEINQGSIKSTIKHLVCAGVSSDTISSIQDLQKAEQSILKDTHIVHFYSPMFDTSDILRNWNRKISDNTSNNVVNVMVAALNIVLDTDRFVTKVGEKIHDEQYQERMGVDKSNPYLHLPPETVANRIFGLMPGLYQNYIRDQDFYTLKDYLLIFNFHPKNNSGSAMMTLRNDKKIKLQFTNDQSLSGKYLDSGELLVSGALMRKIDKATQKVLQLTNNQYYQKPSIETIQVFTSETAKKAQLALDVLLGAYKFLYKHRKYVTEPIQNTVTYTTNTIENLPKKSSQVQEQLGMVYTQVNDLCTKVTSYWSGSNNNEPKGNDFSDQDVKNLEESMSHMVLDHDKNDDDFIVV